MNEYRDKYKRIKKKWIWIWNKDIVGNGNVETISTNHGEIICIHVLVTTYNF